MKDHRISQQQQMRRERRILIEATSLDQFNINTKRKQYPAGSVFKWALSEVYGPIGSATTKAARVDE